VLGLGVDFIAWCSVVAALRWLPVFAVQSVVAGAIALTALYARFVKYERLRVIHRFAIGATIGGLVLVATSAGSERAAAGSELVATIVLAGAVVAIATVTLLTRRVTRAWPSAIMAGLGLGGSSVAVRAMHLQPGNVVVAVLAEPLVYVLVGLWATGLYNWARALRLGDVATVTALFMTTQVLVPGMVGILLLGDTVRAGWVPVTVVGLTMAVWGVQALARRKSERRFRVRVA
jgi:drug/metabolite transporter (DMT)-like permease